MHQPDLSIIAFYLSIFWHSLNQHLANAAVAHTNDVDAMLRSTDLATVEGVTDSFSVGEVADGLNSGRLQLFAT